MHCFFVDLLFYVGWDSRYSEEAWLSGLVVVEWVLIWAINLDAEKQPFRLLSSNVVLCVCTCVSCSWRSMKPGSVTLESRLVDCKC